MKGGELCDRRAPNDMGKGKKGESSKAKNGRLPKASQKNLAQGQGVDEEGYQVLATSSESSEECLAA